MIGPASAWLGAVFGVRRVLMISATVFGISNFLLPFSPNLHWVLAFQLDQRAVLRDLHSADHRVRGAEPAAQNGGLRRCGLCNEPRAVAQHCRLDRGLVLRQLVVALDLLGHGAAGATHADLHPFRHAASSRSTASCSRPPTGRASCTPSLGFSLLYAALDQGNRLDWLNSGLINGLLLGGGLLLIAFVVQELTSQRPWINLRYAASGNIPLLFLLITFFRFAILSTSYIIPQFLTMVQDYRAIEIGGVLIWIALPQFLIAPTVATILRFVEPRLPLALRLRAGRRAPASWPASSRRIGPATTSCRRRSCRRWASHSG